METIGKTGMVVFDMAGTTIDEGRIVYKAVCAALEKADIRITLEQVILQIAGWNKKKGIFHLTNRYKSGAQDAEAIHSDFLEIVEGEYRKNDEIKEMSGASAVFSALRNKGIKVVLDTGYHRRTADLLIDRMGWATLDLIDYSVTSDEVEEGRPFPFMIQKAMKKLGISDPGRIMKVGDTPADIQEGHNAGCGLVVAVLSSNANAGRIMAHKPTHTIRKLDELPGLL